MRSDAIITPSSYPTLIGSHPPPRTNCLVPQPPIAVPVESYLQNGEPWRFVNRVTILQAGATDSEKTMNHEA